MASGEQGLIWGWLEIENLNFINHVKPIPQKTRCLSNCIRSFEKGLSVDEIPSQRRTILRISQLRRAAISVCSNIAREQPGVQSLRSSDFLKSQEVQLLKLTRNLKFR